MKMKALVERYLDRKLVGSSRKHYANVESDLFRLAAEWDKTRRVPGSLSEDWLCDWFADVRKGAAGGRGKPIAPSSYNKMVEHVKPFLEWLVRRDDVHPNVLDACVKLRDNNPREYLWLTVAQVTHMVETATDPWERWVLAYASQTLGRDTELRSRRIRHLRLDMGALDWDRLKKKDGHERLDQVPVTQQLATEWERWTWAYQAKCGSLEKYWFLVPGRYRIYGGRWYYRPTSSPSELSDVVQKHAARVSGETVEALKGQGVHILRRSMARALYERLKAGNHPEPMRVVQSALGHDSPSTTRVYIGVKPDREERNALLAGSDLLWTETSNVTQLRSVDHG